LNPGFSPDFGDELFSLTPADLVCYAYGMDSRQDAPYSPASPKIGRGLPPAEIIFDGTKLALERIRPKTTTDGIYCSFQLYSISQNCARRSMTFAAGARSIELRRPYERAQPVARCRLLTRFVRLANRTSAGHLRPVASANE